MPQYASSTEVPIDRSRAEIERILARYGARRFMYGWDEDRAIIQFELHERRIRFVLPMPSLDAFRKTPTGRQRKGTVLNEAWEQALRQRWRALALCIKAKLESVESEIEEFEDAFMAQIVLPDNTTVGQRMKPGIAHAYETGTMPPLLPSGSPSGEK
jgi:hypothetical protein